MPELATAHPYMEYYVAKIKSRVKNVYEVTGTDFPVYNVHGEKAECREYVSYATL